MADWIVSADVKIEDRWDRPPLSLQTYLEEPERSGVLGRAAAYTKNPSGADVPRLVGLLLLIASAACAAPFVR